MRKNEAGLWETDIDGHKYEFEKWGAEDATITLYDLVSVLGGPIGQAVSAIFGDKKKDEKSNPILDREFDPSLLAGVIKALSDQIGPNRKLCFELTKKLASFRVSCDGKKISYDNDYRDCLGRAFKVAQAALEVQYGNFFGESQGQSGLRQVFQGIANMGSPLSTGSTGAQS